MLKGFGDALRKITNKISGSLFVDKRLIDEIVRDLQRALISADVNIPLVKEITDKIKKEFSEERIKGLSQRENLIKFLHNELLSILGDSKKIKLKEKQNRILLVGLYGAGKTTTIAKLGNYFSKRGKKVVLVGLDVHRPAAKEQLIQLGEKNKIPVLVNEEKDAIKAWKKISEKIKKYDLVLIDTSGRHDLDKELTKEIKNLEKKIKPTETILVLQADIGQSAKNQAQKFKDAVNISGIIITRMDSTAKAGGALTACSEVNAPIYFLANGEKINDIEEFSPESFLNRLLGMGDLNALLEKIKTIQEEKEQNKINKKLEKGEFDLEDFVEQSDSVGSLGGFEKIKGLIPGLGNLKIKEGALEGQGKKISLWKHIIKSMTQKEIKNPSLFKENISRITRVAKGSGVNNSDVRSLLKQYNLLKEMLKDGQGNMSGQFSQKQLQKLAKKFGRKMKF